MNLMNRASGILMPITSLPSPYGIGTIGKAAYEFADFLKKAGQSYWQILPVGPTSYGDSPYQSFSTYAGNPYMIDLDMLQEDGLLKKKDYRNLNWGDDPERVDYARIYDLRFKVLRIAYENAKKGDMSAFETFVKKNSAWVENYALYMAVKKQFGNRAWSEWEDEGIRLHQPEAVAKYRKELDDEVRFYEFLQYLFYKQWDKFRGYVNSLGIKLFGDIPIYVAMDSADTWANPEVFWLDEERRPVRVAGCPPDYFSATGQLWGNPLYNWEYLKSTGYKWWIDRIAAASKLYDVTRIDHFRGFD
ncbi:MAG: 4-alpha-glucanotransferase, partial [Candidatus Spyradocola sp.]